jgi:glycosyltransferase involved in cell wall biosynthesis
VTRRPKLLFLSQTLPYPPDGGVHIRTYNIMRQLARAFEIRALCFYRRKARASGLTLDDSIRGLSSIASVEVFPIPQEHNRARLVWDHARSTATRRAYTVFAYQSAAYAHRLATLVAGEAIDLVHADSLDLSAYFPRVRRLPLVCVHHDAQSVLLTRRAAVERAAWRRAYVRHQARLMEREERLWCPRVTLNVTVSETDAEALAQLAPAAKFTVVPNGVDTEFFRPSDAEPDGMEIVFVGGTTWFPNRDALEYFAREVLPRIHALGIRPRVRWVGRSTPAERRSFGELGIELTGYVEDIRRHVQRAGCYVVPLRVGGGTRVKILDAWAMGKAVVSTSIGCEGLAATDGANILIRDDPAAFAEAVAAVLRDAPLRAALGECARRTVEQRYSWDIIGTSMNERYLRLSAGASSGAGAPRRAEG